MATLTGTQLRILQQAVSSGFYQTGWFDADARHLLNAGFLNSHGGGKDVVVYKPTQRSIDMMGNDDDAPATEPPPAPDANTPAGAVGERLEAYRDIFHDVIEGHLASTPAVMAEHGLDILEQYDIQRFAHHVNAERGNDFEAEADALRTELASAQALAATNAALLANAQSELDAARGERFNEGWKGATMSMLSIIERALENPAGDKLTHIEKLIENFRAEYPKHS